MLAYHLKALLVPKLPMQQTRGGTHTFRTVKRITNFQRRPTRQYLGISRF